MDHNFEFSVAYEIGSAAASITRIKKLYRLYHLQVVRRIRCARGSTEQLLLVDCKAGS